MKLSVALAAYKGEKYIAQQLSSILAQLSDGDEVIVSDDCPDTELSKIVKAMAQQDGRIKYINGPSKGVIKNFENALNAADGDIIFLSDQDDIWLPDKVKKVTEAIQSGADLVLHDAKVTDKNLNVTEESFFKSHGSRPGFYKNLIRNSYMGCCMAFKSDLKKAVLPFPEAIPMHDQWIGLVAQRDYKVKFIEEPLILYRRHENNVTGGKTGFWQKMKWRYHLLISLNKTKRVDE